MVTRRIDNRGVEIFDEDIGGWEIPNPPIFFMPKVSVPNIYDGLRERSNINPVTFNKFVMNSGHNLGLF